MTFEAGRKKQLLVLQPKGKPLYNETSSFGLKMLESMGWKKGSGLGRNQQGNLDFIQVRYKNNANGLGFDGLKDNQWTETEASFDNLLKNLNSQSNSNSNSGDEIDKKKPAKSLEEMSKKSRARVHYKKFTKGKDVYKYSEKDLANILGKKSLRSDKEPKPKEEVEVKNDDRPDVYKSDLMVNTGISITDYFKQKIIEKTSTNASKKFKNSTDSESAEEFPVETKKSKKKKKVDIQQVSDINEVIEAKEEADIVENKKKRKNEEESVEILKKKKKKSNKIDAETVPKKKKRKSKTDDSSSSEKVSSNLPESSQTNSNDVDRPRGSNALYSDVIVIPSHVANKMSNVHLSRFSNSNLGNVVGYGMSDDVEIKVVETKMGHKVSNDKYALYNMDKLTKPKVNQRRILTKIKKTKKSIQVL